MIRAGQLSEPRLITLDHHELRVHVSNVRLLGQVRVASGQLQMTDCTIEPQASQSTASGRPVSIVGGFVFLTRTVLRGHSAGAISVQGGFLKLSYCSVSNCRAPTGGGMIVSGDARVDVVRSNFTNNSADASGGALQVEGGHVHLLNATFFQQNRVLSADGSGASIHLASDGVIDYTFPAPPGRYLFVRQSDTFHVDRP
eukprot:238924-Prymnesium_polylepis.1